MSEKPSDGAVVEIDVSIQSNTLIVGVNGGHVSAYPGEKIVWRAGKGVKEFTLQFYRLAAEPHQKRDKDRGHRTVVVADLPHWPFAEPQPDDGVVGPKDHFVGTLLSDAGHAVAFKYTIAVGNLQLDPIVIIDRL